MTTTPVAPLYEKLAVAAALWGLSVVWGILLAVEVSWRWLALLAGVFVLATIWVAWVAVREAQAAQRAASS